MSLTDTKSTSRVCGPSAWIVSAICLAKGPEWGKCHHKSENFPRPSGAADVTGDVRISRTRARGRAEVLGAGVSVSGSSAVPFRFACDLGGGFCASRYACLLTLLLLKRPSQPRFSRNVHHRQSPTLLLFEQVDRSDGVHRVGCARCSAEVDVLSPMRVVPTVNLECLCIDVDAQHYINAGARETARQPAPQKQSIARIIRLLFTQTIVRGQ